MKTHDLEFASAAIEFELFIPTRFLLLLLWKRAVWGNSNARFKISDARVFITLNRANSQTIMENHNVQNED